MATTARLGIDITATDRSRTAFASAQRGMQNMQRSMNQLKGAFAGIVGGNILAGMVRSLVEVNKHVEPVKSAFTTLERAWQAFALKVGQGGLNDALIRFTDTMSKIIVGSSRLSDILGRTLAGVVNGMRRTFEVLGRAVGFVYDNVDNLKRMFISLAVVQMAIKVFTLGQAFVRLMLAVRTVAIVTQILHALQRGHLVLMLGTAAAVAQLINSYEDLEAFMGRVWKAADQLVPVLGEKLDGALKLLGLDTRAFTEDFDKFGETLKRLPKTFDEVEKGKKAMRPFDNGLMDLKQYVQGIKDQTVAVGMSEGALARLAASQEFYNKMQDKGIKLTAMQRLEVESWLDKIPDALSKLKEQQSNLQFLQDIGQSFADAFTNGFSAIVEGSKSVGAAIKDMVKQLISSLAQLLVNRAFQMILNGPGGSGGLVGSAFGAVFGGGRAAGGPVTRGQSYLVGEHGPETFVPGSSGAIIPGRGGGGSMKVEIHNHGGQVRQQESRGPNGERQLKIWFDAMFDKRLGGQSTDAIMGAKYGLSPAVKRR